MGWWSETILGGDIPLDIQADLIVDVCNIAYDDFLDEPVTSFREDFNVALLNMVRSAESYTGNDRNIAYQVLGILLMSAGSEIPATVRTSIIKAAEEDEWAAEGNNKRIEYVQQLIQAINQYDDRTPIRLDQEGLFDKFAEHFGGDDSNG